ncbi:kinase-like domain-containing protein [Gymnopilus junonius]|uniref:Kinase-like domain-containing protein n=1 Tax=Gymnopilus junonius TaxID=109634 RepID=A0A9P5NHC3_GYMJU|nr:kinase-like domain-containing protein [Gymnopilus junonius]
MQADASQCQSFVIDYATTRSAPEPLAMRLEVTSFTGYLDEETAFVTYGGDRQVYDSGSTICLSYQRNKIEPDAVENKLLQDMNRFNKTSTNHPKLKNIYPTATLIKIVTSHANLMVTATEDENWRPEFLPIPTFLSHIATVNISELRYENTLSMDVDRVGYRGQTFAFKQAPDEREGGLEEIAILDRLRDSPNIIDLEAIVVDKDNLVRGFMMPYMHHGTLEDIQESELVDGSAIGWPLRLSWARQITRGVVDLHSIGAYNAVLIDFLPAGITKEFAAPEVVVKFFEEDADLESVLTGPADIYSLGIILQCVAKEKSSNCDFGDSGAPVWYKEAVDKCLSINPEDRPSALEVLDLLCAGE